ncbi:MAG: hypothetical protein LiPW41_272 [Parcubacteria group bacterium LiPW_41]|nr:MAG: hypothetical protein LiPW41_272 [Parcubacteria group bacterium LiPW_41]
MNRDDSACLLSSVFSQLEEMVSVPTKYLDFCVTLRKREEVDGKLNILSFKFDEETKTKVFVFPSDSNIVGTINSRAILYHADKFFRVKREEDISIAIASLFPEEFDVENLEVSFEIRSVELNELSKFVLSVDKVKKKFK